MTGSAKQSMAPGTERWIASSLPLLAMTKLVFILDRRQARCRSRAASTHKIQKLGNEAGLPTLTDIAAVKAEFEAKV